MDLERTFHALLTAYGPQKWWPTTLDGDPSPTYNGIPPDARRRFEIATGAILTQNTNWGNVERAIVKLNAAHVLDPEHVMSTPTPELEELLRPSGYFRMKAARLRALTGWWMANVDGRGLRDPSPDSARASLLSVKGVGPETADSILLYCFNIPTFVVDAYSRRIMSRLHGTPEDIGYEELRKLFMDNLPRDPAIFNEFHALLVRLAKESCAKRGCLGRCPLAALRAAGPFCPTPP